MIKSVPNFCVVLGMVFFASCTASKYPTDEYMPPAIAGEQPNYAELYYWAAHPYKHDLSDSTPMPYRGVGMDSTVDVFFIHPTTYTDETAISEKPYTTANWNASVNDASINATTDFTSMLNQASVFNRYRVFAPRYRQAHIQSFQLPDSISKTFFDTAYIDIKNAFEYYLNHFNNGRPFIIAAHSQGTLHAGRLIKEEIEGRNLQSKMVIAYIIGMPVPDTYFTSIKPCNSPDETGCFVSWRTFRQGYIPERVQKENFKAVVVNPVSWNMDSALVPRSLQHGAVLYKFNKAKPQNVSTQIHGNILWSSKPKFFGNLFFTRKNYHIGDINLFWKDIRDNVDVRVNAFRKK